MAFEHIKAMYDEINEQFGNETSENSRVPFGELLMKRLNETGISQAELSRRLPVSKATVSKWVSGKTLPKFYHMHKMSGILNVEPSYFTKWAIEFAENENESSIENGRVHFRELLEMQLHLHNMSKRDLAERMGLANSTVTYWCDGQHIPTFKRIYEISHVFGVETSYFTKGAIEFAV